jgi:hypothetical protein
MVSIAADSFVLRGGECPTDSGKKLLSGEGRLKPWPVAPEASLCVQVKEAAGNACWNTGRGHRSTADAATATPNVGVGFIGGAFPITIAPGKVADLVS